MGTLPETDFASHHIEGYALADREQRRFSVPLVSHIEGNLWTGGCIDGVRLGDDFRYVVSLYPWEKYTLGSETERLEAVMYDAGSMPNIHALHAAADQVVAWVAEGKTLVHCQAGLNRSGLVAALALTKMGHSAREAIDLLREKRSPVVLCNATFEAWLLGLDGAS
jgi:Dual specificity phosphatase, catalytic domain